MKLPQLSLRDLFWLVLVVVVSLSTAYSAEYDVIYSFGFGDAGEFAVIEEKPVLVRKGGIREWADQIHIQKDRSLIHLSTKKALSYPLEGDDPNVTLGAEKGTSDKWIFNFGLKDDGKSVVRAANGKFKGWYLDLGKEEESLSTTRRIMAVRWRWWSRL